jgi:presenilin-like A22 family membrane protease
MKYSWASIGIIIFLFLIAQFVGLAVNQHYTGAELPYGLQPPDIKAEFSPWFFVAMIIGVSVLFFVMRKFKFKFLMKAWFFIAFVVAVSVSLSVFMESWIAFIVAVSLILLKFKIKDTYVHNLGEILIYGGIVALFAPILNLLAVIILLILISIYDFIAVFITKHMIGLAKMQSEMGIFAGLVSVYKNEVAILGGGDIAFTLLFAAVLLKEYSMLTAIFAILGATVGLVSLMIIGKKKKFYPAMPFITIGALIGFALTLI